MAALSPLAALSLALLAPLAGSSWSGPSVWPTWNAQGVSAFSIDGAKSAPGFLVGNTQGSLDDDWPSWAVELQHGRKAGLRIFGVCPDGSDLLRLPQAQLSNHTKQMVSRVLATVPDALVIPRVPIGTFLGPGSPFERAQIMAEANSWPGHPAGSLSPVPYGSLTAKWAAASAARMATFLKLLDAEFPGRIGGVHLSGLAAGEMRWEQPPEDFGLADYSNSTTAEFCSTYASVDCTVAPTALERCTAVAGSNIFVSNASAEFNLFLSMQVQRAISDIAQAAKAAMDGKGLVLAFYGYLNELGGHRMSGSGHLALNQLLHDKNIDGIVSPYKYDNIVRHPTGPLATMGPFDIGPIHKKFWISEDECVPPADRLFPARCPPPPHFGRLTFYTHLLRTDTACCVRVGSTRTSLATLQYTSGFSSCNNITGTTCDANLMRRNLLTSALHGAGICESCNDTPPFPFYPLDLTDATIVTACRSVRLARRRLVRTSWQAGLSQRHLDNSNLECHQQRTPCG